MPFGYGDDFDFSLYFLITHVERYRLSTQKFKVCEAEKVCYALLTLLSYNFI